MNKTVNDTEYGQSDYFKYDGFILGFDHKKNSYYKKDTTTKQITYISYTDAIIIVSRV